MRENLRNNDDDGRKTTLERKCSQRNGTRHMDWEGPRGKLSTQGFCFDDGDGKQICREGREGRIVFVSSTWDSFSRSKRRDVALKRFEM